MARLTGERFERIYHRLRDRGRSFDDPTSPVFLAAVGLLVVLAVGAPIIDRGVRRGEEA